MTYVVTGAGGHLGNNVVRKLLSEGETVRALVYTENDIRALEDVRCEKVRVNILNMEELKKAICPQDTVIHCAGMVSIATHKSDAVRNVNVLGTQNVIRVCKENGVKKLVHVSSVHAIPELPAGQTISEVASFDPETVTGYYAKTKAEATKCVLDAAKEGLNATVVHPSGIIGPGDFGKGHLTQLVVDFVNGKLPACVKGGYDFVDVRDVASGILAATQQGRQGECYILSGNKREARDLLDIVGHICAIGKKIRMLPTFIARCAAPFFEAASKASGRAPLFTRYSLYTLHTNSLFSHQKATQELGYSPRSLEESLRDTVDWLRAQGRIRYGLRTVEVGV